MIIACLRVAHRPERRRSFPDPSAIPKVPHIQNAGDRTSIEGHREPRAHLIPDASKGIEEMILSGAE
jgi:hypothetical protein